MFVQIDEIWHLEYKMIFGILNGKVGRHAGEGMLWPNLQLPANSLGS